MPTALQKIQVIQRTLPGAIFFCYLILSSAATQALTQTEKKIDSLLAQMTLEEKVSLLSGESYWTTVPIDRLDIPSITLSDGPTGVRSNDGKPATVFPVGVAVAATWNVNLVERMAASLAREARAMGTDLLLAPTVNIQRSPLGGRNFESYSEDPYLAGHIGAAFVNGLQSEGVGATIKHFVANNQEHNRLSIDAIVSDRALREIYLATFEHIVKKAKPWAVMTAYNQLNGHFMTENASMINTILKGEWHYDGVVMSDWGATHSPLAAEAGLGLEMPGPAKYFGSQLLAAHKKGDVSEHAINDSARRILRLLSRAAKYTAKPKLEREHDQYSVAQEVAAESITLLKNEGGLLPLSKASIKTIAIIGPNADTVIIQGGGSSHVVPAFKQTPLEAITALLQGSGITVTYAQGTDNEMIPPGADYRLFSPTRARHKLGLTAEHFNNQVLSGEPTRIDLDTHFEKVGFGNRLYNETSGKFSMRWRGFFFPTVDGDYDIHMIQSGASQLTINGQTLVTQTTPSEPLKLAGIIPATMQTTSIALKAGQAYPIEMTYLAAPFPFQYLRFGIRTPAGALTDAIAAATEADIVVLFAGVSTTSEQEGHDRPDMAIHGDQNELIEKILAANKNTVVVLNNGGPVEMPWIDKAPAVLNAWLPGQQGPAAIADILFGNTNPSGKLPLTFPVHLEHNPTYSSFPGDSQTVYEEGILVGYRYYDTRDVEPLFPFGHGLSYTTFHYTAVEEDKHLALDNPNLSISVEVENTGDIAGFDTIQLYVSDLDSSESRPAQELKSFRKVFLQAGEKKTVSFVLNERSFAFWSQHENRWKMEAGEFEVRIGRSSRDIKVTYKITAI